MKLITILLATIIPFAIISCGEKEKAESQASETAKKPSLDHIILKEKPANSISIAELRTKHKAGETITFSGQVIGSTEVFMDGLAVMTMGDPTKMTTCNLRPGDNCQTPWDACCDDPDVKKNNIVTIQILDPSGATVKVGLKGLSGIKEMSDLVITGVVEQTSNNDNMVVNATGIFVN